MSTTLGVIPVKIQNGLTFGNVIRLAEKSMSEYLESIQMKIPVRIEAAVHDMDEKYVTEVNENDVFTWKTSEFALFTINQLKGGPEAYCEKLSNTLEYWENYIEDTCGDQVSAQQVKEIKANDVKWYFTRASGHSALINLAYGHLAAATAVLTQGILFTKGGWDPVAFPTKAAGFLEVYFKPERTMHAISKKWAEKSLHHLRESAIGKKALLDFGALKPA